VQFALLLLATDFKTDRKNREKMRTTSLNITIITITTITTGNGAG